MKKTILVVLFAVVAAIFGIIYAYGPNPGEDSLREGDVIFHASDSRQAPILRYATSSPITHCGTIIDGSGLIVPPITVSNVPPSVATSRSFFRNHDYVLGFFFVFMRSSRGLPLLR